jgi:8-oxo-dGTP pyrophosphatase MutT (NUDIX family)
VTQTNSPRGHGFLRVAECVAYENSQVVLFDDEVTTPLGAPGRHLRLQSRSCPLGVVVVAAAGSQLVLIHVHRYALDDWSLELPRGTCIDMETPEVAALRELAEETGILAADALILGYHRPDTSILETEVAIVTCCVGTTESTRPDPAEAVDEVLLLEPHEVWERITSGEIRDGFTLGAMALLHAHGRA